MGVLAPGSICPGLPKLVLRTSFGDLQEKAPYSCAVANSSDCHNSQRLTACAKMLNWHKFWKRGRTLQVLRDFDVAPNGRAIPFRYGRDTSARLVGFRNADVHSRFCCSESRLQPWR